MPQQVLHGSNVSARLQQVGGKKWRSVWTDAGSQIPACNTAFFDCALQPLFKQMVPALNATARDY
jgi:hypothetical protein